jgi:outer membrane protein OmpA-like peptidoglycan-associated protein
VLLGTRFISAVLITSALGAAGVTFRDALPPLPFLSAAPDAVPPQRSPAGERREASLSRAKTDAYRAAALPSPTDDPSPTAFDVIRIDPDGTSVFAGRGPAGAQLTILANGVPVTTVRVDPIGQWAIALEHHFDPGEYQFALAEAGKDGPLPHGQRVSLQLASAKPPPAAGGKATPMASVLPPAPITFVYDEANFTDKGRAQARLFAAFLRERGITVATLSGHADERGSDLYNVHLSQQRLDAVVRYLREAGFSGRLVLLPMGKREPFTGVDREGLTREEALGLDRRVELRKVQ